MESGSIVKINMRPYILDILIIIFIVCAIIFERRINKIEKQCESTDRINSEHKDNQLNELHKKYTELLEENIDKEKELQYLENRLQYLTDLTDDGMQFEEDSTQNGEKLEEIKDTLGMTLGASFIFERRIKKIEETCQTADMISFDEKNDQLNEIYRKYKELQYEYMQMKKQLEHRLKPVAYTTESEKKLEDMINNLIKSSANKESVQQLESRLAALSAGTQKKFDQMNTTRGGAVYTRWGRTSCPTEGTETVYSGYAGGSHYTHKGGAAEYICLPKEPVYGQQISVPHHSVLYGAEYETDYFGQPWQQDVPCAVCRSSITTNSLMIPATNKCNDGWKLEYHGKLASGYHGHEAPSQFVCVDDKPQAVHGGGNRDDNGKLFYSVKSQCGSLKCPPYEHDKLLLCVVCTK